MVQPRKPAENIGSMPLNSGVSSSGKPYGGDFDEKGKFIPHVSAAVVRECDPNGAIVVHPVRRSAYAHERLHSTGKLADEFYDAAEKFRSDFERAQLFGNYARLDLFKTRTGKQELSDSVAIAKGRIAKALEALGGAREGPSFSQSVVWNVVGLGITLEDWTQLIRAGGASMNADKASGVLHGCLERLAVHYGMIDKHRIDELRQDGAYKRGIKDFLEFAGVFAVTAQGGEKNVIGRFLTAAQKRFEKFGI
jgi:Domain of unknown function (DUF6456)